MNDKTIDPYNVLGKLSEVADDHEADVLEKLGIKAGYWWKCFACGGHVNPVDKDRCESCDRGR